MVTRGKTMQNVYSNLYSQAVTHPSTNRSQPCLTSVIGRELVYSRWYGRRHLSRADILMQKSKSEGRTDPPVVSWLLDSAQEEAMGWVKNVSMRCLQEQADSCCNNVQSLWWKLPLGWKLILNPPHRGRLRVTSATFNAAWVRDREKRVHHHQHFCWFENNEFSSSRWQSIWTLPQHFQNDKRQKT